jgi:hypothetical protein
MKSRRRAAHVCDAAHIVKPPPRGIIPFMEAEAPGLDPGSRKAALAPAAIRIDEGLPPLRVWW